MSQQRIIVVVALCLIGAVAMVAGQSWNPETCTKNLRAQADLYRERLVAAARKFTSSLQNTAGQAIDTSVFQKDLDKLTQNVQEIANVSQGFDMGRFTNMYLDSLSTMASMMRSSLRLYLISGTMGDYIEFGNEMYSCQTTFLHKVTQGCMPQSRVQPVAPSASN